MRPFLSVFACLGLMLAVQAAGAAETRDDPLAAQRARFLEARALIESGSLDRAAVMRERLAGYPLAPYLDLWLARARLKAHDDEAVRSALAAHPDIPEAVDLRLAWIRNLAERGQWPRIDAQLAHAPVLARLLPAEIPLLAAWHNGRREEAFALFARYWRAGRDFHWPELAGRLARLERDWRTAGHPDRAELRDRLRALAQAGRWPEAIELADAVPDWRVALENWRRLVDAPERLDGFRAARFAPWAAEAFAAAIRSLSRTDVHAAWKMLPRRRPRLDGRLIARLKRKVALRAARHHEPDAIDWLARLPSAEKTHDTRAWRVRLLLLGNRWEEAARAIRAMPDAQRGQSRWRYWLARAEAGRGQADKAKALWRELASERGYYGFLAAARLHLPPALDPAPVPDAAVDALARRPAIRRAREWLRIGDLERAVRAWESALARASRDEWLAALRLALDWQWYDRAIRAAWRAGAGDALDARFPLAFADAVLAEAKGRGIAPDLVWSVIRQESAFDPRAVSRSGARGLMQLMPATAREIARKTRLPLERDEDLFDPALNIRLGAAYLAELFRRFDGAPALVAAAYNAGPSRVREWLARMPVDQIDVWIEAIPFSQTRRYVQHVLAFRKVYRWRMTRAGLYPSIAQERERPRG
ncbi:MAG: transglycosylase SLT domain-containing protein [Mariprofundaceae bacterium]